MPDSIAIDSQLDVRSEEDSDAISEEHVDGLQSSRGEETHKSQQNQAAFSQFLASSSNLQPQDVGSHDQEDYPSHSERIIERARDYQQELFEKAKEENLIAVLDTGSGKTLIACLLVRYTLTEELVRRSRGFKSKIIIFMANSVHLVRQQAQVLANNLSTCPSVLCGNDKTEVWKKKSFWESLLQQNVPVVCTPAILQQCLDAALLHIDQISLLIFDEAHHAKKNHPYSRIVRSHYLKCKETHRPKIFGMTASPVDSKADPHVSTADLEQLLHSKIITTTDMSILSFAPRPKDVIWTYQTSQRLNQTELYHKLQQLCGHLEDSQRGFDFADYALTELGPWCADRVWAYILDISDEGPRNMIKRLERSRSYTGIESVEGLGPEIKRLEEACSLVRHFDFRLDDPDDLSLAPKVLHLRDELSARYEANEDMRGIVFVDRRLTALTLHDCIRKLNLKHVRTGVLLGASTERSIPKDQRETLSHFRAGLVNLIFATSVADEGIDIPQCNLCIRFDLYKTPIQYMQSRGRARMAGSLYVHMIEEGNLVQENAVQYVIDSDVYIKEFCQSLPPDRLLGQGTRLQRLIAQDSSSKLFKTDADVICDFGNCLSILSNFASSLQNIGVAEREIYEEQIEEELRQFRYIVRLPLCSEVPIKGARGEWRPTKQLAKRSAAFNCCFLLRRQGFLDENLRSTYCKVKPDNLNAHLAVSGETMVYPMSIKPVLWSQTIGTTPTKLFATIIKFDAEKDLRYAMAPIVLLTRTRLIELPTFEIFAGGDVRTSVNFQQLNTAIQASADEMRLLTTFTLDGVYLDVFNKTYDIDTSKLTYWLAPLNPDRKSPNPELADILDMRSMHKVRGGRLKWSPESDVSRDWSSQFICDPRNGNFRYFSQSVAKDVKALDHVPASVPKISQKSRQSIIDFSDSYWKASKKNFAARMWDPHQPVLNASLIKTRRNFLEPLPNGQDLYIDCLIAPQPLEVSRLDPGFAASCLVWPTIIHRIEAYMIALAGVERVGLRAISAELALEAFTKHANADELDDQDHYNGPHSIDKNYERLEFIGDSLLKMMTTITVFLRTNCDEEGMHCRRMEIINNRHLFQVSAERYNLSRYVRTATFGQRTWYPEYLTLLKGRGAHNPPEAVRHPEATHELSMKTIADVSEALIGAAVMATQHLPKPLDLGIEAITLLVDSPDHDIKSWDEIAPMYKSPPWSLVQSDVIANDLANKVKERTGYTFNHPRLLRSAFTHPSDSTSVVPDLQRLEFLGDAVLDWVSISWLFNGNPDRNPQWLTEHKMAMVSNKFLAALAVTLDFDKFIQTSATPVLVEVSAYAQKARLLLSDPDVRPEFWTNIDSPPKALSDLVESYLGAVLLDSNFNYHEIEVFFNKHILWFFKNITRYDGFASKHPTSYLHKLLQNEYKCRNFRILNSEPNAGRIESSITAGVLVHGQVVASATAGNARVAKVKASKIALEIIGSMTRDEFAIKYDCNCKSKGI